MQSMLLMPLMRMTPPFWMLARLLGSVCLPRRRLGLRPSQLGVREHDANEIDAREEAVRRTLEHDDLHGHRPNHRCDEERRTERRRSRDEKEKTTECFHHAGEVPEPLPEPDGAEDVNPIRRWVAGKLLESRPGENEGNGDAQRQPGGRNG